jgi:hypothetical protein
MPLSDMWLCGFCGEPVWKLRRGVFKDEPNPLVIMAWHAVDAHQVDMGLLDQARGDGKTWVLPDGRVWLRQSD